MTENSSSPGDERPSATDTACVTERDMLLSALDTLVGGLIILDSQLRIVTANKNAVSLLGVPAELVEPQSSWEDFVRFAAERGDYGEGTPEEQYERVMPLVRRREPYELTRRRPDGVLLEINGNPIVGGGYVTRFRDVTSEKKTEADLASATKSSQRFRRFFELSQEMMASPTKMGDCTQ